MKICFKCSEEKPLIAFYAHPRMADGHLNKCIDCARKDVSEREARLRATDPDWTMKERERCRIKIANRRKIRKDPISIGAAKRWQAKHPEKRKAHVIANNALKRGKIEKKTACEGCGATDKPLQMHHPDYAQPLFVKFLCSTCHGKQHRKPIFTINPPQL